MTQAPKGFIDLTELPFVKREISGHPRVFFDSNHPYQKIKSELKKLSNRERSVIDLLQLFRVWGRSNNRKIAEVIMLNNNYYTPIFSSLAAKIYHPTKNYWIIFALLAGIVSISKFEPIKLTGEIFDLVNKALTDKRKSISRQAISVIYGAMYSTFGVESGIKPIFKKKIIKSNLATALNSVISEWEEDGKKFGKISLAVRFQMGLWEAGVPITSRIPYVDEVVIEDFKRWFGLKEKTIEGRH